MTFKSYSVVEKLHVTIKHSVLPITHWLFTLLYLYFTLLYRLRDTASEILVESLELLNNRLLHILQHIRTPLIYVMHILLFFWW